MQPKQFAGIWQGLYEREELRFGGAEGVGVDAEEVEALVRLPAPLLRLLCPLRLRAAPARGPPPVCCALREWPSAACTSLCARRPLLHPPTVAPPLHPPTPHR